MRDRLISLRKASFKRKLFFYSLLISLLPVLIIGTVSSRMAAGMIRQEVNHNHQIILQEVQRQVEAFWSSLDTASIQLANHPVLEKAVASGPSAKSFETMHQMVDTIQMQRSISEVPFDVSVVFLPFGKIYNNRHGFFDVSDFQYRDLLDRLPPYFRTEIVPPGTYSQQQELLYIRPVPIFSESRGGGLLLLHVPKDVLSSFSDHVPLGAGRMLYVLDEAGRVLISHNRDEIGAKLHPLSASVPLWQQKGAANLHWNGKEYSVAVRESKSNRWTYVALTPKNELDGQSQRIILLTSLMMLVLATLWVLIARFGSTRLYTPVQKLLQRSAQAPSPGTVPEGKPQDEWGALDHWMTGMLSHNESLQRQLHEQAPYMKETFALQLLRGELSLKEAEARVAALKLPWLGHRFAVCLVDIDGNLQGLYQGKDRSLIMYALRKMSEECLEESFPLLSAVTHSGQVALVVMLGKTSEELELMHRSAERLGQAVGQYFPISVSIACSSPVDLYAEIAEAYLEAREMLSYRLLLGHRQLLIPERMEPSVRQSGSDLSKLRKRILPMVMQGEIGEASALMEEWVKEVTRVARHSEDVLGFFAHFVGELTAHLQEWGLDPEQVFGEEPYKRLYAMTSVQELTEWLTDTVFAAAAESIRQTPAKQPERIIGDVLHHIHEHYDTELSLQAMADRYQISTSHLSRMFKEQTSMGFIDYLIGYRMKKAQEWLAHTDMPIKDIAEKLSYTSVQNFTRVFKQTVKIPPGEYRKQHRVGE